MPEYDAFGREVGEDPLAALRDATAAAPAPVEAPRAPAPVEAAPVARPQFVRPRRRRRGLAVPIVAIGLLGALIAFASVAVDRIDTALDDVIVEARPGLGPESMIREDNLAPALATVRRSGLGRPLTLEVTPRRLVARLVAGNGRRSLVVVAAGREPRTFRLRARGGTGFPYGRIDTAEPERIVRAAGRDVRLVRLDRNGWRAEFR